MGKLRSVKEALVELINTGNEHNEQPYKKIRNFCYEDFLSLLNPTHQKLISKIYLKNQVLNVLVKHQAAYQELKHDSTKFYIKKLIKHYVKLKPNELFSQAIEEGGGIQEIRIFFRSLDQKEKQKEKKEESDYIELSLGKFKNHFESEELYLKFEKIRTQIKKRIQKSSE